MERVDTSPLPLPDLADVRGQAHARRALEVAAAGGHHLLLIGSPGCGKTLLASRLPSLLPDTEEAEALQLAAIASVSGEGLDPRRWRQRPFRAPHHSASAAALVGGGNPPCPGEISLAHHGVLFLDELPEWNRSALETLREPLESGTSASPARHAACSIRALSAGGGDESLPLWLGRRPQQPLPVQRRAYQPLPCAGVWSVAGPYRPAYQCGAHGRSGVAGEHAAGEPSAAVRARVEAAHAKQQVRGGLNAHLPPAALRACTRRARQIRTCWNRPSSACSCRRGRCTGFWVARTIADLAGCETIQTAHLAEAIGYRQLDRGKAST